MDIENIQITIRSNSDTAVVGIDNLVSALGRLKTAATGGISGLNTTANQLKKFSDAVNNLNIDASKFTALSNALAGLNGIEKAKGLSSTISSLKQIPKIMQQLDATDLDKFAQQMERVAKAIRPLATEMQKVSDGFKAFPIRIQKLIQSNAGLSASNAKLGTSFKGLLGNAINFYAILRVGRILGNLVKKSSEYTETLNLFNVALGKYAREARAYADEVSSVMGIDPAEWMRAQGVFMTLATGFGIAGDKAAYMSKNLTQLGYDISSYYNISVEDAMQKLQSGISGELEPLRRLGYDLSQAKLEATALALGITKSVSNMTQAEKGLLRYQAVMTQVTQVQGDMARTLESPANQLRILQAAANQAARALGNIFIPALNKILPYAIAFLNVIRTVANAIANLFGFSIKEVDYGIGDAVGGAEEIEESLGGGASSAKKMKDYLMGIDELNVIPDQSSGGGGGGGAGGLSDMFDFELEGYDFLGDALSTKIQEIQQKMERWLPIIKLIGISLAAAFAIKGISNLITFATALGRTLGETGLTGTLARTKAAALGLVASFALSATAAYGFGINGKTLEGVLASLIIGIGGVGTALYFMLGPVGLAVAAFGTLVGTTTGFYLAAKKLGEEAYKASESYERMAEIIANSQESMQLSAQTMDTLASNTERINEIDADWATIQGLVDRIYELSDMTYKGVDGWTEFEAKVKAVNEMNVDDLHLTIDRLNGTIVETRDSVQEVIDKLYEQARVAAYTEMLTQAYKDQYQAASLYHNSLRDQEAATAELEAAQQSFNEKFGDQIRLTSGWTRLALLLNKEYQEMKARIEGAEEAVAATTQAHEDAKAALIAETDAISDYEQALYALSSGEDVVREGLYNNVVTSALEDIDYDSSARAMVDGITQGFENNSGQLNEATAQIAEGMHNAFDETLGIHSPSTVFEQSGIFAIEGAANGVSGSASLLTDAISNVGTESAEVFGNNYATELMRGVETALEGTSDSAVNTFRRYVSNMVSELAALKTEFSNIVTAAKTMATNVNSALDSIKSSKTVNVTIKHNASAAVAEINRQLEKIGENLSVNVKITVMAKGGTIGTYAKGGIIPAAANGLSVDRGQLFIAREAGPELVAGIGGGRTAVMNNDQIVESVSNGVYRAVVDAMAVQQTDSGDVVLVLGDKEVYRASKRGEKASGYTLVSNPTFA